MMSLSVAFAVKRGSRASLNHRNIVTVYDFDQGDDETLFIAMEHLDGVKLSDVIRRDGPLVRHWPRTWRRSRRKAPR